MRIGEPNGGPRIPPARARVVAVQVIVVGALVAVAFVLFLRPNDGSPLFGIGIPPDDPRPPHTSARGPGEPDHDRSQARRAPTGEPGSAATQAAVAAAAPMPAQRLGGEPAPGPSLDQYADRVARLEASLR